MKKQLTSWKLKNPKIETVDIDVPGDITYALYRAGIIEDPYFAMNYKNAEWIAYDDFTYEKSFDLEEKYFADESIKLVFEGIDLFAEIELNGKKLGKTDNMFKRYVFDVTDCVKNKGNLLKVYMTGTKKVMQSIDYGDLFGTFNLQRILLRKTQCHFGWDWAPDLCGYGIWNDVYIESGSKYFIDNVNYTAYTDGWLNFIVELNYNVRDMHDNDGNVLIDERIPKLDDYIEIEIETTPQGKREKFVFDVTGKKNIANVKIENPALWWPSGYGEQPLYAYSVRLYRGGKQISQKTGRAAFRKIELKEEPISREALGFYFNINGTEVFCRGANWVPAECFTGNITEEKYKRLVLRAKSAGFNMLRVWGGGLYEKEVFYDYCDENGIMVLQDMMLSCSDYPENNSEWVKNFLEEVEYQIKRLRTHPSIVCWDGGNEKNGEINLCHAEGDFLVDVTVRGLINRLDGTRPYLKQSPSSKTDVGNDYSSGDSHNSEGEVCLVYGIDNYRALMAEKTVAFLSECALQGPNSVETNKKIYPEDKLLPPNELWRDRLMENPYSPVKMDFLDRQSEYIRYLYGKAETINQFVVKGSTVHCEMLRAEVEYARSNRSVCGGVLIWMYNDIWPSGTWSVVDYYGEPKGGYYQLKRSFADLLVSFVQGKDGKQKVFVANDTTERQTGEILFGAKNLDGTVVSESRKAVEVMSGKCVSFPVPSDDCGDYLYVYATLNGKKIKNVYSKSFWKGLPFKSNYTVSKRRKNDRCVQITFHANEFAKSVFIVAKDNYKYSYSDNFFDLEKGEDYKVTVTGDEAFAPEIFETGDITTV